MEPKASSPYRRLYAYCKIHSASYPKDYSFGGETNSHLKPKPIVVRLQSNRRLQISLASIWIAGEESF